MSAQPQSVASVASVSGASNRTRLTRCLAVVELDATCKPSVDVYMHEIPILEAAHGGRGMVTIVKKWDKMVENFDVYSEWERLRNRYNKEEKPYVEMTYRNGPEQLAKAAGVEIRKLAEGELEPIVFLSTVVDNGDPNGEILPVLEREPVKRGRKAATATSEPAELAEATADPSGF